MPSRIPKIWLAFSSERPGKPARDCTISLLLAQCPWACIGRGVGIPMQESGVDAYSPSKCRRCWRFDAQPDPEDPAGVRMNRSPEFSDPPLMGGGCVSQNHPDVMQDVAEVRALMQRFQDAYTARNPEALDDVMDLFVADEDLEVIGTKGIVPGEQEWCRGPDAVRKLIADDWAGWGDVVYDVAGSRIHVRGDTAWLATTGQATMSIPTEGMYGGFVAQAQSTLNDDALSPKEKMLEVARLGSDIAFELPLGETFIWPFRFTAVAVRDQGEWRFHQMQFSYSNTRFPDERQPVS